ncbi:sulfotransferase family protein [Vibrio sp. Vb339]|uniref:sulfotransferase family protein n=1 Tax=Vibrio sp. Vb339 TaxID=1192013 RepID=UPI0015553237|nr:sulfotransferase [Vibrio sp. Vb339]
MKINNIANKLTKLIHGNNFTKRFYRIPINRNENISPIFIIGAGRSGNTLLRRILNQHSEVAIPPETYVLGVASMQHTAMPHVGWHTMVTTILGNFQFHPDFYTFKISNLNELHQSLKCLPKSEQSFARIINEYYLNYLDFHGIAARRWGDKTPLNVFYLDNIKNTFPKSQFIHIVRDPVDSVSSFIDAKLYSSTEEAIDRWVKAIELAEEFNINNKNSCIMVYYSDLVTKPEETISGICDFLDVSYEESMMQHSSKDLGDVNLLPHHANVNKPITPDSIGKGYGKLNYHDISILKNRMNKSKSVLVSKYLSKMKKYYEKDFIPS